MPEPERRRAGWNNPASVVRKRVEPDPRIERALADVARMPPATAVFGRGSDRPIPAVAYVHENPKAKRVQFARALPREEIEAELAQA